MKNLLGQYSMWIFLGKRKFLWAIFEYGVIALEPDATYGAFFGIYQRTTYLNLGADSEEFAWTVFYVDIFLGNLLGFSGIHSRCTCSTLERRYELPERSN